MHPIVLYILLRNVEPSSSKNTLITNFAFSPAFNQLVRNYIQALSLKKCSGIACVLWSSCVKSVFTGHFFLASNIYFLLCVLLLPLPASLFYLNNKSFWSSSVLRHLLGGFHFPKPSYMSIWYLFRRYKMVGWKKISSRKKWAIYNDGDPTRYDQ